MKSEKAINDDELDHGAPFLRHRRLRSYLFRERLRRDAAQCCVNLAPDPRFTEPNMNYETPSRETDRSHCGDDGGSSLALCVCLSLSLSLASSFSLRARRFSSLRPRKLQIIHLPLATHPCLLSPKQYSLYAEQVCTHSCSPTS